MESDNSSYGDYEKSYNEWDDPLQMNCDNPSYEGYDGPYDDWDDPLYVDVDSPADDVMVPGQINWIYEDQDAALFFVMGSEHEENDVETGSSDINFDIDDAWDLDPQLAVLNLRATHPLMESGEAIKNILKQVKDTNPEFASISISLGRQSDMVTRDMLDFAYLGHKDPSILEAVRHCLVEAGYDAIHRPHAGNDRTREIHIYCYGDHRPSIYNELKEKVTQQLRSKGAVLTGGIYVNRAQPSHFITLRINDRHLLSEVCKERFLMNNSSVWPTKPPVIIPRHPFEMHMQISHDESVFTIKKYILNLFRSAPDDYEFKNPLTHISIVEDSDDSELVFVMRTAKAARFAQEHWTYHLETDTTRPLRTYVWNSRLYSKKVRDDIYLQWTRDRKASDDHWQAIAHRSLDGQRRLQPR